MKLYVKTSYERLARLAHTKSMILVAWGERKGMQGGGVWGVARGRIKGDLNFIIIFLI